LDDDRALGEKLAVVEDEGRNIALRIDGQVVVAKSVTAGERFLSCTIDLLMEE
jgi:hypothetical protein